MGVKERQAELKKVQTRNGRNAILAVIALVIVVRVVTGVWMPWWADLVLLLVFCGVAGTASQERVKRLALRRQAGVEE